MFWSKQKFLDKFMVLNWMVVAKKKLTFPSVIICKIVYMQFTLPFDCKSLFFKKSLADLFEPFPPILDVCVC